MPARVDDEYKRCGTANIFLCVEPLTGKTIIKATERRAKIDFAHFVRDLCDGPFLDAEKLVVVMDNLNTHSTAPRYEAFPPAEARRLAEKLEIHHTPNHGSGLDIAEIGKSKERKGTQRNAKERKPSYSVPLVFFPVLHIFVPPANHVVIIVVFCIFSFFWILARVLPLLLQTREPRGGLPMERRRR
jgi:hypothetical protein